MRRLDGRKRIEDHINDNSVKKEFETIEVYKRLDDYYYGFGGKEDAQAFLRYVENPVAVFEAEAAELKRKFLDHHIKGVGDDLKALLLDNISYMKEVLTIVNNKIKSNGHDWADPLIVDQYFDFWNQNDEKIESYDDKHYTKGIMSPIINQAFQDILKGEFSDQKKQQALKLDNGNEVIYSY